MDIDSLILDILDSEEYKSIEYLVSSMSISYLEYLWSFRSNNFEPQPFIIPLLKYVDSVITENSVSLDSLLEYMLSVFIANGKTGWLYHYYMAVTNPIQMDYSNPKEICCSREVFMHIVTGFILDYFRTPLDIGVVVEDEKQIYPKNDYGLSVVNDVEFKKNYFIYDGKAYMYNRLTNIKQLNIDDGMPGFAKIITDRIKGGDILLRLDERLALPIEQAITISKFIFVRYRGPSFHFNDSKFHETKTIIVHITPESENKLLMIVKKDYDFKKEKDFFHIEIETLPRIKENSKCKHVITTFLHGMYYIKDDIFTHIDYTKNQYSIDDYRNKYFESTPDVPIDLYTASKKLHYKIWCIENGEYSREIWYQLMIASLPEEYQTLLNEILEKNPRTTE